jgi:hypothetical protein
MRRYDYDLLRLRGLGEPGPDRIADRRLSVQGRNENRHKRLHLFWPAFRDDHRYVDVVVPLFDN